MIAEAEILKIIILILKIFLQQHFRWYDRLVIVLNILANNNGVSIDINRRPSNNISHGFFTNL